ncbi:Mucin-19-like isoform X1 [Oopsacas minuta]|uniref:Mucin-19-like isoform X1 n=1 Tax=Oopsacas minuta TaxID=111878 RepID=A0AAV7JZE6_9METZ|nr:Mucin-19-like isoform X1 [Oopsacas minuta]
MGGKEFEKFLHAEVYLDSARGFFGPEEKWIGFGEFFKPVNWISSYYAWKNGASGNSNGEGRLLGALYIISNDRVELEFRPNAVGDFCSLELIKDVIRKL